MGAAAVYRTAPAEGLPLSRSRVGVMPGERLAVVTMAGTVAMLPLLVPAGPANIAPVDALIALSIVTCLLWAGRSGHRWRVPYVVPVVLLLAGGAIGGMLGPVPRSAVIALVQDGVLIVWCWAVVNLAHRAANLRLLMTTWAYSSIVWATLVFVGLATGTRALTGQIERQGTRVHLTLADPSYAANYLLLSLFVMWAIGRPRRAWLRRSAYVLLIAAMVPTGSNSGMLSLIVGVGVATAVGAYRRHGIVPAASAAAAVAVVGFLLVSGFNLRGVEERAAGSPHAFVRDGIGRGTSVDQRSMLVGESLPLYRSAPPLGQGPVSTKARLRAQQAPFIKEAHNDYLAALIERGAVGFLGVAILVAALLRRALSVAGGPLANGFASVVLRPNALAGAIAAVLVVSVVYEIFHVRHVWTMFAFVAALSIWGGRE
jgi:O-antigen ligase